MFSYGYGRRRSSVPSHLTAWNGLNFSRSIHNPNSRLNRLRSYLSVKGEATKAEILRDVFGRILDNRHTYPRPNNTVTSGWGTYLFSYGVRHGFFKKVRRGNKVYWSNA